MLSSFAFASVSFWLHISVKLIYKASNSNVQYMSVAVVNFCDDRNINVPPTLWSFCVYISYIHSYFLKLWVKDDSMKQTVLVIACQMVYVLKWCIQHMLTVCHCVGRDGQTEQVCEDVLEAPRGMAEVCNWPPSADVWRCCCYRGKVQNWQGMHVWGHELHIPVKHVHH